MNALRLIALTLVLGLAGCTVPDNATVRFFGLCSPPVPDAVSGSCVYPATCSTMWIGPVELDADVASQLVWPVQVDNQTANNSNTDGRTNTDTAWIQQYLISYTSSNGPALPDVVLDVTEAPIEAASSQTVNLVVIPPAVRSVLVGAGGLAVSDYATVKASIRAKGRTGAGAAFETGEFVVVAGVCRGARCNTTSVVLPPTACSGTLTYASACPGPGQTAIPLCK